MIKQTTLIHKAVLKAALTHAGKLDVRYYLNGVYIDRTSGHVVATDGHRMLIAKLPADSWQSGESFIVPRDQIEAALKLTAREVTLIAIDWLCEEPTPDPTREGVTIKHCPTLSVQGIMCKPIDGRYPEWRRVCPTKPDGQIARFNPEYLLAAYKALATIAEAKNPEFAHLSYNGMSAAVLTRTGVDALVAIMPMRDDNDDVAEVIAEILKPATPTAEA